MKKLLLLFLLLFSINCVFAQDDPRLKIGTNEIFQGPIGLQLYSLRDVFSQDIEEGF